MYLRAAITHARMQHLFTLISSAPHTKNHTHTRTSHKLMRIHVVGSNKFACPHTSRAARVRRTAHDTESIVISYFPAASSQSDFMYIYVYDPHPNHVTLAQHAWTAWNCVRYLQSLPAFESNLCHCEAPSLLAVSWRRQSGKRFRMNERRISGFRIVYIT